MSTAVRSYNIFQQLTGVRVVSTSNLTGTYFNGPSNTGIGATITALSVGILTIDSVNLVLGNKVLLVGQSTAANNGIYMLTTEGTATVAAVLTRVDYFDTVETIRAGWFVTVAAGTVNAGSIYTVVEPRPNVIGTDAITFARGDASGLGTAASKAASDNTQASVASVSGATVLNHSLVAADTAGTVKDSGVYPTKTLVFTLTAAQLASAGKVNIQVHSSASSQYYVNDIKVLKSTGLSGGSGDRLLAVTDGTLSFNNAGVTAAVLGTPIFTLWGGTGNPIAAGTSDISTAGADVYFQYAGGTTDYTTGSVMVAVTIVQVTA